MLWRLVVGIVLVALVVTGAVLGAGAFTRESGWDRLAGDDKFSILQWESQHILGKWLYVVRDVFRGEEPSEDDRIQLVEEYLELDGEITALQTRVEAAGVEGNGAAEDLAADRERLAGLIAERDDLQAQVEEIIEGQISAVLADEGLARPVTLGGTAWFLFPPVDFAFESRPNVLIVSPRGRIEIVDTTLLDSDMTVDEKVALEAKVEKLGYSALVEQVGAVATYPSIVPPTSSLMTLLSKVGHEWMHHYLFFHPLGRNYWSSYELTTINETAADMAGAEIASLVYDRYYRGVVDENPAAGGGSTSSFDFGQAMRETRVTVDALLAEGQVDEAERYMAERRLFLQENGYYIRKLNQAYFAFHGSYADTPASTSPIGDQLRELRLESGSLGDFIRAVSRISDYEMLVESVSDSQG